MGGDLIVSLTGAADGHGGKFRLLWVDVCMTDSVGETGIVLMNHNAPCVVGALCLGLDV